MLCREEDNAHDSYIHSVSVGEGGGVSVNQMPYLSFTEFEGVTG